MTALDDVTGNPKVLEYPLRAGSRMTRVFEVPGEGVPIVLVHGAGARAERWRSSLAVLASAGRHAVAFDLPGHGFASKGTGFAFSATNLARFVSDVLEEVGIDRALLVGTSLGGHVVAELAVDRPHLPERMVLVGPTGLVAMGRQLRQAVGRNLRATSREGIRRKIGASVADPAGVDEGQVTEEWRVNTSPGARQSLTALAEYFEDRIDDELVGERLRAVVAGVPTMVVWGENDTVVPVSSKEEMARLYGITRVEYIAGAGHWPYAEKTEEFWECLLPFLAEG